jgi:hypothetical protein
MKDFKILLLSAVTLRTAVNALLSAMKLPTSSNTSACALILNDSNVIINTQDEKTNTNFNASNVKYDVRYFTRYKRL